MSSNEKRAEYLRRAEEAREAAKASAHDQLKMVLYQIARLWERMADSVRVFVAASGPGLVAGALWTSLWYARMHLHEACCWLSA